MTTQYDERAARVWLALDGTFDLDMFDRSLIDITYDSLDAPNPSTGCTCCPFGLSAFQTEVIS